jgi:dUTP pyrophosphatase
MKIPTGYAGVVMNKSGVSSKTGLDKLAELVDEDYQGEIHINVVNTGTNPVVIRPGDKIAQMIITPVYIADLELKNSADEVFTEETVRGEGGFGSTNKNDAVEVKVEASVVDTTVAAAPTKKRGRPKKQ